MNRRFLLSVLLGAAPAATYPATVANTVQYRVKTVPLFGGGPAGSSMDYLGYESGTNAVWIPGGTTGTVHVVGATTKKVTSITGFATEERCSGERKRTVGPELGHVRQGHRIHR